MLMTIAGCLDMSNVALVRGHRLESDLIPVFRVAMGDRV